MNHLKIAPTCFDTVILRELVVSTLLSYTSTSMQLLVISTEKVSRDRSRRSKGFRVG